MNRDFRDELWNSAIFEIAISLQFSEDRTMVSGFGVKFGKRCEKVLFQSCKL